MRYSLKKLRAQHPVIADLQIPLWQRGKEEDFFSRAICECFSVTGNNRS
jgi:hypothetical protein